MSVLQFSTATSSDESVAPPQQQQQQMPVRMVINGKEISLKEQIRQQQYGGGADISDMDQYNI